MLRSIAANGLGSANGLTGRANRSLGDKLGQLAGGMLDALSGRAVAVDGCPILRRSEHDGWQG